MEKKQSSVEWFYQRILAKDIESVFEQAKAMHKEEIIDAANKLLYHSTGPGDAAAKQYYNETFGGNND